MKRFAWDTSAKAFSENIVLSGKARFTIITERLIRMEYHNESNFVDEASQMVFYRDFMKPKYESFEKNGKLYIDTDFLKLEYVIGEDFNSNSLSIALKTPPATNWKFGEKAPQLKGTACTLDNVNGSIELEDGVCSRNGFTVIDDSKSALLSDDGWFKVRPEGHIDFYFFGYGFDYRGCLADFYRLTGAPPLLPSYAFGNWWSRYEKYSQQEYCELMERFERENIPFSVAVLDMDWHRTVTPKESCIDHPRFWNGWTGYSWNKELFPDYKGLLKFLKDRNLKTALNLHPSNGIGFQEDMYPEMARACKVDPDTKKLIKFDVLNPDFMENYFDILHHPYEDDGVDFWWMDWQQGEDYWWIHDDEHKSSELEIITPLWMLNHLHILDITRNGKRPMFFSRYCGLGAHRYPVGFSGDTITTWESLDFQPYFTANASNAGYCWWSHDIGGHMQGIRDDDLQIRWLQLGVFSPINRLHSTNNVFSGKEPWKLCDWAKPIAEDWLKKRHELFPYIYTMNYRCHNDLLPLIQPMYYSHPNCDEAYGCPNQFWFGSELMVAPITSKQDYNSLHSSTEVWLPEGKWIDFFTGLVYSGNRKIKVHRKMKEFPVFAKAGAIVPMEEYSGDNLLGRKSDMNLHVFAGGNNNFSLYEDLGDGEEYKSGDFVTTDFILKWGKIAELTICAAKGNTDLLPDNRNWNIHLKGFNKAIKVKVLVDDVEKTCDCYYDSNSNEYIVEVPEIDVECDIKLEIIADDLMSDNSIAKDKIYDLLLHAQMGYSTKTALWDAVCRKEEFLYNFCADEECKNVLSAVEELYALL